MTATMRKLRSATMSQLVTLFMVLVTFLHQVHPFTFNDASRHGSNGEERYRTMKFGEARLKLSSSLGKYMDDSDEAKSNILQFVAVKHKEIFKATEYRLFNIRFLLRIVMYPIISAVFIFAAIHSSNAAVGPVIKNSNKIVMSEFHSIFLKGFVSGACINLAKNVILHPLETGKST